MPDTLSIKYFLADRQHPVIPNGDAWDRPLPQARNGQAFTDNGAFLTYGRYFAAVHNYLAQNDFQTLRQAAAQLRGPDLGRAILSDLSIYLEKHGQYYHPARAAIEIGDQALSFVINLAVTENGRAILHTDVHNIQRLQSDFPYNFLPLMYDCTDFDSGGQSVTIALGEWLCGFFEFHLSRQPDSDRPAMAVWDPMRGAVFLTERQTRLVFRQAAKILTAYLNLETFEQILNWHNAAGDFVVQVADGQTDVRLITIRRYGPLFPGLEVSAENVLHLLSLFLLNNSLRLCLDRCDGIGEPAWAGRTAVSAILEGILDGLQLQVDSGLIPDEIPTYFRQYLNAMTVAELQALGRGIVENWHADAIGRDLALSQVEAHAGQMEKAIRQLD